MIAKSKKQNGLAFSYARFSDEHQAEGNSQERQTLNAEQLCDMDGLTLLPDHEYSDWGKSAFRGKKQHDLDRLMKAVNSGAFEPGTTMILENIDRLSRKGIREARKIIDKLFDAGINIKIGVPMVKTYFAVNQDNNFGDTVELAAFSYMARVYSENLSARILAVNASRRRRLKNGESVLIASVFPCWLEHTGKGKFKTKPAAVKSVKYLFKQTIAGVGARALARDLNQNGKFPPIGRSNSWTQKFISGVIKGRQVLGELATKDGEVFLGYYPSVIDEDTHLKANMAIAGRRSKRGPSSEQVNVFAGRIFSASDDCPMHMLSVRTRNGDGWKKSYRFKSSKGRKNLPGSCSASCSAERLEDMIFEFLPQIELERKSRDPHKELLKQASYWEDEIAYMNKQIKSGKQSARVLGDSLMAAQDNLDEINMQIAVTPRKLKEPTKAYRKKLSEMKRGDNFDREVVKDGLATIVERIDVLIIKLGPHSASPVKAVVEIKFRTGDFVRAIELDKGKLVSVKGTENIPLADQCKNGFRISVADYEKLRQLA